MKEKKRKIKGNEKEQRRRGRKVSKVRRTETGRETKTKIKINRGERSKK